MEEFDRETLLGLAERQVYRRIFNCIYSNKNEIVSQQLIKETELSTDATFKRAKELASAGVIEMHRSYCNRYVFSKKDGEAAKEFEKMAKRFEKKK